MAKYIRASRVLSLRMSEIYKTAKGEPLPGLEVRRNQESEMCLQGLAEARK